MATSPLSPPILPTFFGTNFGNLTPIPPVLLGAQQLTTAAAAFTSIFIQPVNSLMFWLNLTGFSGSDQPQIRFNNDSGANYWFRLLTAAPGTVFADTSTVSTTSIRLAAAGTLPVQVLGTVGNPSATAAVTKVVETRVAQATGAAGTAGTAYAFSGGEWVNTANPIARIDVSVVGANNFSAGSSLMVWGGV